MSQFSTSVEIPASPDRVWAVLSDIERWPEWTPTVRRIRRPQQGPLAVGSRARGRVRLSVHFYDLEEELDRVHELIGGA